MSNLAPQARKSMRSPQHKSSAHKTTAHPKTAKPADDDAQVRQLRSLAHDLSNSLEAILQATYLLHNAKLDSDSRRWVQLIDTASQDAARTNRELRKMLRALCDE